ncbi:MAG: transcription termination/antitermination protein NusA, partial [Chloroflexi bacterium RBG_13_53_26]
MENVYEDRETNGRVAQEMKTEFVIALTQLAAERNLPKEVILKTVESALVPIFKKTSFAPDQEITVKILTQTGDVKVFAPKKVVKRRTDPRKEMLLSEARKLKAEAQVGDVIEVECTPENAGRIAAQTAKQVILQRLREAERDAIFGEYADKEGDVVSGVVNGIEPKHIRVDLGKAEAILPLAEQMATDRYRMGQRLKYYLLKVLRTARGTQLVVSRTHQNLLRRLFEIEIPEVYNGTVEIKAVAREPGYRSKVAVAARQEGVDAVGSCLGLRSIRMQNITKELGGEKIDIIQWHPDPTVFIGNALSPASIVKVEINGNEKNASVVVPDKQLSLAIGKGGQNARLAARLTGWRIDIKSTSMLEGGAAPRVGEVSKAEKAVPSEAVAVLEPVEQVVEAE